jgi:hypothetical protein
VAPCPGLKREDAKKTGKEPNFFINFVPRQLMANPHLTKANQKLLKKMAAEGGCFFLMWADPFLRGLLNIMVDHIRKAD